MLNLGGVQFPPTQESHSLKDPMTFDQIQCKNCSQHSVFRRSKRAGQVIGQKLSETDTAPIAVSCPQCEHVYMYKFHETTPTLWTDPPGSGETHPKHPNIFFVPLECAVAGCQDKLIVTAARSASTPLDSVLAEARTWELHDLECPNDHPILLPRVFWPLSGRGKNPTRKKPPMKTRPCQQM